MTLNPENLSQETNVDMVFSIYEARGGLTGS